MGRRRRKKGKTGARLVLKKLEKTLDKEQGLELPVSIRQVVRQMTGKLHNVWTP